MPNMINRNITCTFSKLYCAMFLVAVIPLTCPDVLAKSIAKDAALQGPNNSGNEVERAVNWTPVLMQPSTSPQLFQGSDNKYNLAYELVLTSFASAPLTIESLTLIDTAGGAEIKKYEGSDIASILVESGKARKNILDAGRSAIVYINLEFDSPEQAPGKIEHVLELSAGSKSPGGKTGAKPMRHTNSVSLDVNTSAPLIIAPPLRGGDWVAIGGYAGLVGHRRTLFPLGNKLICAQRYAIDWMRIDENKLTSTGDLKKSESYSSYGQPLLAVADGTVYGIIDRFDDQVPDKPTGEDRMSFPTGNCIVLDIGGGRYAMYAHLKRGSLKVKTGDKVKKGDTIALLGNSGNTTAPHLHLHITDGPQPLESNGVPYLFDDFQLVGETGDLERFFKNFSTGKKHRLAESKFAGRQNNKLIREGHIVRFAD